MARPSHRRAARIATSSRAYGPSIDGTQQALGSDLINSINSLNLIQTFQLATSKYFLVMERAHYYFLSCTKLSATQHLCSTQYVFCFAPFLWSHTLEFFLNVIKK